MATKDDWELYWEVCARKREGFAKKFPLKRFAEMTCHKPGCKVESKKYCWNVLGWFFHQECLPELSMPNPPK